MAPRPNPAVVRTLFLPTNALRGPASTIDERAHLFLVCGSPKKESTP